MRNYSFIAFITTTTIIVILIITLSNGSSVEFRNKRSLFSPSSELNQESLVNSEIEVENQLSSDNLRNVREYNPQNFRTLGADDDQYPDAASSEGSAESSLKLQLKNEYQAWKERNEDMFKTMNDEADIPLRRISFTSKYMWDQTNQTVKTYNELKDICTKNKLEMVEIRHEMDFSALLNFLTVNPHIIIGLGANDNKEEGTFLEADSVTPIGFQMFLKHNPDNGETKQEKPIENCVTMAMSSDKKEIGMKDSNCKNIKANIICQRRRNTSSYADSAENIGKETEGLDTIGDVDNRRYFIGRTQKTWEDANKYCDSEGKRMLDLGTNETLNHALYRLIVMWRLQKYLHEPTGFWTSGQFQNSVRDSKFIWQSNQKEFDVTGTKNILWQWVQHEPADSSGRNLEKCIDISFPYGSVPKGGIRETPELRASNCQLPFYFVCYEKLEDDSNCRENRPMQMTAPHSKYLYDANINPVSHEDAYDICEKWGYEMAEVQSLPDLVHLANFIFEKSYADRVWHIGLSDKEREGEFLEGDRKTPISFQSFSLSQPDNYNNQDCVVLRTEIGRPMMYDEDCSFKAQVLCQFRKDTSCYTNSQQNLRKPRDDLIYFGETAIRRYFLSRTQKKWVDAMEYCSSRNKKLLDILFMGELEHFKGQQITPLLIHWARKFNAGIWTSGRYPRSVHDGKFNWETTGESFLTNDKSINFTWTAGEPADKTHRRMELCIELAAGVWSTVKPGESLTPMLKATNCLMPNYFVCYEDAPHLKNCHLPPNVDFTFQALSETSRYIYLNLPRKMNASETKETCNYWGLDVAEISSLRDYKLVSNALDSWGNASQSMIFRLGLNSVGSESMWFEGDGFTPIKFQAFGEGQPTYYGGTENKMEPLDHSIFTKIRKNAVAPAWQMVSVKGSSFTNVLCQFKKDSTCAFQDIFNYLDRKSPKNYLKRLNDGKENDLVKYYVADSQQTWEEAMRFCWSRKKKLLDLNRPNFKDVQRIYSLIAKYLKKNNIHPSIARFWTSGKYVETFQDTQFRWESIYQFVRHTDAEKDYGVQIVRPAFSTADNDRCVSLGLADFEPRNNGTYEVTLKPSNCYLPYFFLCYEQFVEPEIVITSTTEEPIIKYKDLPPCKDIQDPEKKKMQEAMLIILKEIRPPGFLGCDFNITAEKDSAGPVQAGRSLPNIGRLAKGRSMSTKGKSVPPKGK